MCLINHQLKRKKKKIQDSKQCWLSSDGSSLDSDLGFFAGLGLRLGLAAGKFWWTRTQVQH